MLILTRRQGDMIYLNDDITIEVVRLDSQNVKLCVRAPKDVQILREELIKPANGDSQAVNLEKALVDGDQT